MSRIFPTELLKDYIDLILGFKNRELSSSAGDQMFISVSNAIHSFLQHFSSLGDNLNSLDSNQLKEFEDLNEFVEEYHELRAQSLTTEEINYAIENLSLMENNLPLLGKIWLGTLRKEQELRKTK